MIKGHIFHVCILLVPNHLYLSTTLLTARPKYRQPEPVVACGDDALRLLPVRADKEAFLITQL